MDPFDFDNNVLKDKTASSSMQIRFRGLREIKRLFRIMEIFLVLFLLKWAATRLPFAIRISGEYFRLLISIVVSHLFIFLVSNVIVLTLFFNSRNLFPQQISFHNLIETHVDFCQEIINNNDSATRYTKQSSPKGEEIVYQDKQTILEEKGCLEDYCYHECCSCGKQLRMRRLETERRRRVEEVAAKNVEMVDEMSNEEFQRAIEAFIAKQIRFHQEEKLAIVLDYV